MANGQLLAAVQPLPSASQDPGIYQTLTRNSSCTCAHAYLSHTTAACIPVVVHPAYRQPATPDEFARAICMRRIQRSRLAPKRTEDAS